MKPAAPASKPQAQRHRGDFREPLRPWVDPQDSSALPTQTLGAALRYFSALIQKQDDRLAARRDEIHSLAKESAQQHIEIDKRDARIAQLENELRIERSSTRMALLARACPARLRRLAYLALQPVRRLLTGAAGERAAIIEPNQDGRPDMDSPPEDHREQMGAVLAEGRFLNLKQVTVLVPEAMPHGTATAIAQCLAQAGLHGTVRTAMPQTFCEALYIVVNPSAFPHLPPPDRSIGWLVDTDQTASGVGDQDLAYLSSSLAIFDMSLQRIQALQKRGIALHQIFYVPLDPFASAGDAAQADTSPMGLRHLFARALHGCGVLGQEAFEHATRNTCLDAERFVLCLPESPERFANAMRSTRHGALPFPGIRQLDGWRGTAMSYRHLARAALAAGRKRLLVWEDDAAFPADFEVRLEKVLVHLDAHEGEWDVFSGLLTDLHERAQVQAIDVSEGELFLLTDTMIGMVFGIYGPWVLQALADYQIEGDDVMEHTVDRYLEGFRPRCFTVFPPLVAHDDAFSSTLWKRDGPRFVSNEMVNPMIHRSQLRLVAKMIDSLERDA